MAEIATGDAANGLGNGRTWYRLPLWIQKSWGPWTSYGGGGVAFNNAPGMANYGFAGWLLQREFGQHLTLGGEIYTDGPQAFGTRGSTFYNIGGGGERDQRYGQSGNCDRSRNGLFYEDCGHRDEDRSVRIGRLVCETCARIRDRCEDHVPPFPIPDKGGKSNEAQQDELERELHMQREV